jgi:hypothetical protein
MNITVRHALVRTLTSAQVGFGLLQVLPQFQHSKYNFSWSAVHDERPLRRRAISHGCARSGAANASPTVTFYGLKHSKDDTLVN